MEIYCRYWESGHKEIFIHVPPCFEERHPPRTSTFKYNSIESFFIDFIEKFNYDGWISISDSVFKTSLESFYSQNGVRLSLKEAKKRLFEIIKNFIPFDYTNVYYMIPEEQPYEGEIVRFNGKIVNIGDVPVDKEILWLGKQGEEKRIGIIDRKTGYSIKSFKLPLIATNYDLFDNA